MSQEVAQAGQFVVPARYRNQKVEVLGRGISSGFPIIRIKGKEWSLSMGKDEEHDIESRSIEVVILKDTGVNSRQYYPGGYQGAGSKGKRPTCWSLDGKRPEADVQEPESPLCDTCAQNRTYTNEEGRKVRNCQNGRRLAVLPWVTWTTELLGKPLLKPCLLRVPGASLQALMKYGEDLGRLGVPYFAMLTRISFEKKSEFPKLVFEKVQVLDDQSLDIIDELCALSDISYITGEKSAGGMKVVNEDAEEEAPEVKAPAPKPAAVSLAQAFAAAKTEAATEVKEGEILPPEKPKKASPKVKVTHNGKAPEEPKPVEAQGKTVVADTPTDDGDDDQALRDEVMKLVGA
jgi:hypothetical protein